MFLTVFLTILVMASPVVGTASPILAQQTSPNILAQEIFIRVDGASCPFCAFGLEKRLGLIEGVAHVRIEMRAGEAIITLKKRAQISEQVLRRAVEEAGFTPREIIFPPKP